MERCLRKRENERIHQWIDRIAIELNMTSEQTDAMREVAMESYIKGSDDVYELNKKKYRQ